MTVPGALACCDGDERRKAAVLGNPVLNGIDYLEVLDQDAIPLGIPRQQTLLVHCLNPLAADLAPANVLIDGGESITGIGIAWVARASDPASLPATATVPETAYYAALYDAANTLVVRTRRAGDFSPYTLRLVGDAAVAAEDAFTITETLAGFDPELAQVEFSFKVECPPDFDCLPVTNCPPERREPPPINYLAKDYGSFRGVMLDRLMQLVPWSVASEADIGVVLAELIAYVGDHLSYQQDAVATEAYIGTARSRISLRRHALFVDYAIHDGCNARAWIQLSVNAATVVDPDTTRCYTWAPGMPSSLAPGAGNDRAALAAGVVVFEPMHAAALYPEHNLMRFYTWGESDCCLAAGAIEATLAGSYPNLKPGDVLIFQEMMGPRTGVPADADLRHRCAVRLTQVTMRDAAGQPLVDPLFTVDGATIVSAAQAPMAVTEIQWASKDALPFPVCISSSFLDDTGALRHLTDVSVVLGNIVLADHGLSLDPVRLGEVPEPAIFLPATSDRCDPQQPVGLPVRWRPVLPDSPVSQAVRLPLAGAPVTAGFVPLTSTGFITLLDTHGFPALSVQSAEPWNWPQYFGVIAAPSTTVPGNFALSVVYDPLTGGHGVTVPVTLEHFPALSLTSTDPNYALTVIAASSRFLEVPTGYTPPGAAPAAFPAGPIRLPVSGPIDLVDSGASPYLRVEARAPLSWPPAFAVMAQGDQQQPDQFGLLLVYDPPSGEGVSLPVLVERFDAITLANAAATFADVSTLLVVRSFENEPNPSLSASALMTYAAAQALPEITLMGTLDTRVTEWAPLANLLHASPADPNFVVEVEFDGTATLRPGDGINGLASESRTDFTASYRVGNGTQGNVGAESLVYLAVDDARIIGCINPLPAAGGVDPETAAQIRRRAPAAFLTQERAITMDDYAEIAEREAWVEDAVADLRWTGSWYTVFLAAEPVGGGLPTPAEARQLRRFVDRYRLAGQDLEIRNPEYVSLLIELTVCVDPAYFRTNVEKMLMQVLGSQKLADGRKALFEPGTFRFGQDVYLSPIYRAARSVPGVTSLTASVFRPQGSNDNSFLDNGVIPIGPLQVARMDNDPSYPSHGQLVLKLAGGK